MSLQIPSVPNTSRNVGIVPPYILGSASVGNTGIVPPALPGHNGGVVGPLLPAPNGNTGIVPPSVLEKINQGGDVFDGNGNGGVVGPVHMAPNGNTGIVPPAILQKIGQENAAASVLWN
jgi:hypothetical protein